MMEKKRGRAAIGLDFYDPLIEALIDSKCSECGPLI